MAKNDPTIDADAAKAPAANAITLVVFAKRAMSRAKRPWNAGRNDLTADQVAEIGEEGMKAITADPNFTVVAADKAAVMVADAEGNAIKAHTMVMAKRAMCRAGRAWSAGATPFDEAQAAELLTPEVVKALQADPNFCVVGAAALRDPLQRDRPMADHRGADHREAEAAPAA